MVAFALGGCASTRPMYGPLDLDPRLRDLGDTEIEVTGYLVFTPQGHVMYSSKEVYESLKAGDSSDIEDNPYNCLTIANPNALHARGVRFGTRQISLRGKLVRDYLKDGMVDLGGCGNETALLISAR